jgi:16S rRNA (uracil1498-N3)-methyltransferase
MSERFFLAAAPQQGQTRLQGDEARHLARVLRAKVGDAVTLFDGSGRSWLARVTAIGRDDVGLEVETAFPAPEPAPQGGSSAHLTLAVALPKGDRQKWMVEKLTELGVARLIPLTTTRGVAEATAGAQARLERVVIEACKQSGRNTLMEIAPGMSLAQLAAGPAGQSRCVVADPGGTALAVVSPAPAASAPTQLQLPLLGLVGPEGGFTPEELAAADSMGCTRIGLGPHILRVETAAIALAAKLL